MAGNILNVDDNKAARYLRSRALEGAGFRVLDATSGGEALEIADQHAIDVAIVDVKLPDMSGLEVTRRLRANPITSSVRIAQVSEVCISSADETQGLQCGADVYLKAPEPTVIAVVTDTLAKLGPRGVGTGFGEIGIAQVDMGGYFVTTNERYCELIGRDTFELGLHRWIDTLHDDDFARVEKLFADLLAGAEPRFRVKLRQVRSDGVVVWTDNAVSLLRGVSGVVRGVVVAAMELT